MKKITFSETDLFNFKNKIENGISITSISKEIGVDRHIISRELKKYFEDEIDISNRKYCLNENYFSSIDSEDKAYWLGFISADGNVYKRGENGTIIISFNLNIKDKNHLQKFLDSINSNAIIKEIDGSGYGEGTKMASLYINSKKMGEDLIKLGVVPRKSLILKPPSIEDIFIKDWIRGYFDGDGSITPVLNNGKCQLSFLGTKEVLIFIQNFLTPNKTIKLYQKDINKNNFSFNYGGKKSILNILDKFYLNPSIYLERKYKKVLEVYSRFGE